MNLLQIVPSYYPAVRYGGPIRSVHGLAKGLVRLGHRVHVLTTDIDGPGRLDVPTGRPVLLDGVEVRYCPVGSPRRITRAPAMRAELGRLLPEVDLVHLHAVWQWPTWLGARMAARAGVPYLVSPRGMLVRELIARKSALAKKAWLALVERRTLAQAAAIHATSEREAEEIRALGLDLAPIRVVPNGVDLPDREPAAHEQDAVWQATPRGRRILYLGRLSWEKGVDRLVRAVAAAADACLCIAGNDAEGLTPRLTDLATGLGAGERVRFAGAVEGSRKWALLAGADLLVLPSVSENWGIVVTEALGVGTPVVVTRGVGAAELVARYELGAVVDAEPAELARAIEDLLADPARRAAMGQRGRRIVAERFSHEAVARAMSEVYRAVLAGSRATSRSRSVEFTVAE